MAYEFVSFDLDGTLVDTLDSLTATGNAWLATLGYEPLAPALYRYFVGNGAANKLIKMLNYLEDERAGDEAFIKRNLAVYRDLFAKYACVNLKVPPKLPALLLRLRQEGITYAVLTNKDEHLAHKVLETAYAGTGVEFPIVCGNKPQYVLKPDPSELLHLLDDSGVAPEQAVHVGDSDVDIFTAKRAKLTAVGVLWGFRGANELKLSGADYLAETVEELERCLLGASA